VKLSILIPTLAVRKKFYSRLLDDLLPQVLPHFNDIEVIADGTDTSMTIGAKRNKLLARAKGDYVCFIDDDDRVGKNYIETLMRGIEMGVDVVSLRGIITTNGKDPLMFEHSLLYKEYRTVPNSEVTYERYPNHLNCMLASVAKQFEFPHQNYSEDTEWATKIFNSGLLKTEYHHKEIIYYYLYRTVK